MHWILITLVAAWTAFLEPSSETAPSLTQIQRRAKWGELPVGSQVVIAVQQSAEIQRNFATRAQQAGSSFCAQPTPLPQLPAGVWHCEVRADRQLWPVSPFSLTTNRATPTSVVTNKPEALLFPGAASVVTVPRTPSISCPTGQCR